MKEFLDLYGKELTFKDHAERDLEDGAAWFNPDEFADFHIVNGAKVLCVIVKKGAQAYSPATRITENVRDGSMLLCIRKRDFATSPAPDQPIFVDGKEYCIRNILTKTGIFVIEYGGVSSGQREPVGRPRPI